MIFVFLSYFTIMIIFRSIQAAADGLISFFFMAEQDSIVRMYVCMCVCIYTYIHTHHIFFSQSSVDEHLGCFHVLVDVNTTAINIGVRLSFPDIYPRVGLLDQMATLFLVF